MCQDKNYEHQERTQMFLQNFDETGKRGTVTSFRIWRNPHWSKTNIWQLFKTVLRQGFAQNFRYDWLLVPAYFYLSRILLKTEAHILPEISVVGKVVVRPVLWFHKTNVWQHLSVKLGISLRLQTNFLTKNLSHHLPNTATSKKSFPVNSDGTFMNQMQSV